MKEQINSKASITNSVEELTTTGILQEKIFCQTISSVSEKLNDAVMTKHAMYANLLKQHTYKTIYCRIQTITVALKLNFKECGHTLAKYTAKQM